MSTATKTPAVPRLSASILLINPRNEILLVHRPTHSRTFPNAHVFPGGATSPTDTTQQLCALRETFEETGLLLTSPPPPPSVLPTIPEARAAIHAGTLTFSDYLATHNLTPATADLIPFTKWITPPTLPRRFETQMFLYFMPVGTGQAPSPDGVETLSTRFIAPQAALDAAARDELVFFPPQYYLMARLAPHLEAPDQVSIEDHSVKLRRRMLERWARGGFGALVMEPTVKKKLGGGKVLMGLGEGGDPDNELIIQLAQKGEPKVLEIVKREEAAKL